MRAATFAALLGLAGALGAPAIAQTQRAPVPIALPHPPPVTNQTSSALFDAMLAISRAQLTNPQAAQNASFQYVKAIEQYRSGNASGARTSALRALSDASQPAAPGVVASPSPPAALAPAPAQVLGTQGGLYGADAPAIDADSFLALARGTIDECAARHDKNLGAAQRHYALAARAFAARNWESTRVEAKAAIDACAKPLPPFDNSPR